MKKEDKISKMLRVNHAGEFGAKQIYSGQIKVFNAKGQQDMVDEFTHMRDQEEVHFNYFDDQIKKKQEDCKNWWNNYKSDLQDFVKNKIT